MPLLAKCDLRGPCAMPLGTSECWGEVQAEERYAAQAPLIGIVGRVSAVACCVGGASDAGRGGGPGAMRKIGAPPKPGTMQGCAKGCGVVVDAEACVAAAGCGVVELCDAAPMPGPGGKASRTLRSRIIISPKRLLKLARCTGVQNGEG